jgi:hypothetical protein
LISAVIALLPNFVNAQEQPAQKENGSANVISGRISTADGQPLTNARVGVGRVAGNAPPAQNLNLKVDSNGAFQSPPLEPGLYSLFVIAPGLIRDSSNAPASPYLRPGDTVNIKFVKGGVITGTVKNSNGNPLVAVPVRATRVKGPNGEPVTFATSSRDMLTDDRGVYRLYGLFAGTYVVSAGGPNRSFGSFVPTAYEGFVPTFAPSATRDTAMEIQVTNGNESQADIQFREEHGHVISGSVIGTTTSDGLQQFGAGVTVFDVRNRTEVSNASAVSGSNYAFAVYGVPDGDYEIYATQGSPTNDLIASPATPIKVQGADVAGVRLTLAPLVSIEGRVIFEADPNAPCGKHRANVFTETMVSSRRYEPRPQSKDTPPSDVPTVSRNTNRSSPVDARGVFNFKNLQAGTYQIEITAQPAGWYLRSVALARSAVNISRDGLALKRGDHLTGLAVTFAEGAAKFKGHLSTGEGQLLPLKLRVYLVPEEREAAGNFLRFYEAAVERGGSFTLDNVAPGRYLLLARRAEENELGLTRLMRFDETLRATVLKEAEALKKSVALKPCEQVTDFDLPYVAPR